MTQITSKMVREWFELFDKHSDNKFMHLERQQCMDVMKAYLALAEQREWQSVDNAPRDELILGYSPSGRMVGSSFHVAWWSPDDGEGGGVWHNSRGCIGYHSNFTGKREGDLTHWMLLPQPPGGAE